MKRNHTNRILIGILLLVLLTNPCLIYMQEQAKAAEDPVSVSANAKGQSPFLKKSALFWAISGNEYQKPNNGMRRSLPENPVFANPEDYFVVPKMAKTVILGERQKMVKNQNIASINRRAPPTAMFYQKHIIRQSRGEAHYGKLS